MMGSNGTTIQYVFFINIITEAQAQKGGPPPGRHHHRRLIPMAAAFDSFWDSQIGETLTRCLLTKRSSIDGGAVAITRVDLTAAELRAAAGREKNGSAARRMLALPMVLDGETADERELKGIRIVERL